MGLFSKPASFGDYVLRGGKIRSGLKSWPAYGAVATVESSGQATSRVTATRVATGAVVLGPLGAVLGGLARKDTSRLYLTIVTGDGTVLTAEVKPKREKAARAFAAAVNVAASRGAES